MMSRRRIVVGAAGLGALILILILWRVFFAGGDEPALLTADVTRGDIEQTVEATGTLEPKEMVSVGAQVSGRLETLNVEVGQVVRKGELIAQIDAQTQTNTLRTAQAELANMQAQRASQQATLAKAELSFRRQQAMVPGEATSMADFEAAEADLKSARAQLAVIDTQIQQARVGVNTAEINLGYTRIVAPMDGVVVAVVTKQGQTVNANQSAPTIVILAQLDVMQVKAEISEADVIKVDAGLPVYFTILGDADHRYNASLLQVEPAPESIVDEVNSTSSSSSSSSTAIYYNALFEVPNTDGKLRALMTAQVSIVLARKKNVLLIPSSALGAKAKDGTYSVRVMGAGGRMEQRQIRIGINNNVSAEVLSGLKSGEKVVVGQATEATASSNSGGRMGPPPF
ncbi:hemolysin secretion protein D [Erythrobacter sp. SG61-1L]|uniref:efflux RND transporter periplasmic adaptor subunit n=1 Tax=Erythrobacter sp. SG61-1L TaxID=1603897 RepID=UPI0006C937A2|nr:efflux RND transporter periplasmic adaptor subunit [Erythrobacter sp. SG61-1L]KPL66766.1 hemolysin secretion protein D [Erythrobacter sp. SG61-1L]